MRKKTLALLLVIILAVTATSIAGCGGETATPSTSPDSSAGSETSTATADASGDTVKIGTPTYLTGANGFTGNESVYGIKLAVEEKGTLWGKKIEYIPTDGVDNSKMPSAAEYLLNVENVKLFIMGSNGVPGAMQAVIQPKGGFQIEATNWVPAVLDGGYENHVQNPMMYTVFAEQGLDIICDELSTKIGKDKQTVRVGILCVAFWQPIADSITEALKARNIEAVFFEVYPDDISDFTPLIAKMKAAEVDVLFHTARPPDAALFLKQTYAQEYRPEVILGNGLAYDQPEFAELGEVGEGCLSLSWPSPSMNDEKVPSLKQFKDAYKAYNNRDPLTHSMTAYVTAKIALDAFEAAGEMDNTKIKQAFVDTDIESNILPNLWGFKLAQDSGKSAYNARATTLLMSQWFMEDGTLTYRAVSPDTVAVKEGQIPFKWFG